MSRSLLRSTVVVSSMTFISRVLGFLRDMIIARSFGAGMATDAFFVAFRIPNFMRRLFAEGAFSLAFVPVFAEYKQRHPNELRELVAQVTGTLMVILLVVTAVGVLAAPLLVWVFAPGFTQNAEQLELTAQLLRLTFPYLLFISLTACAGGMLNSFGQFAVPALTPTLLNVCLIGAALWLAPYFAQPVTALAWGVLVAGMAQLALQLPFLYRLGLLCRPRWGWRYPGVQRILKLMIPTLFGSSVAQINLLFDTLLASLLISGSVSWLYYSDRLLEFPLGVFGVALATVILPKLSREHAATSPAAFSRTLDWALRWALLIGLPAAVALAVLAGPMLTTLFQYGAFTAYDVRMAQQSLIAFALGLQAFILIKVLAPGFYARQDTSTPVKIGIIALVANMILNVLLIWPLAHAGLALATTLSAILNAGLLYRHLRRAEIYRPEPGWGRFLLQIIAASLVMGGGLWLLAGSLDWWLASGAWARVRWLMILIAGGLASYTLMLLAFGMRPRHLLYVEPNR
jgi:putative peptidoglycan lipid II flippase